MSIHKLQAIRRAICIPVCFNLTMTSIMRKLFCFCLLWALGALTLHAEKVYLHSGEMLIGRIQYIDERVVALESDRGFGIVKIDRADVSMIEFDGSERNLSQKFGLGFFQRSPIADDVSFSSLTVRHWSSIDTSIDFMIGVGHTTDGDTKLQEYFSVEGRYAKVLLQEGRHNIYSGAGIGVMSTSGENLPEATTGTQFSAFLGVELFPVSFPNLGVSAEVGVLTQKIGSRQSYGLFHVGFPSLSVRYYF